MCYLLVLYKGRHSETITLYKTCFVFVYFILYVKVEYYIYCYISYLWIQQKLADTLPKRPNSPAPCSSPSAASTPPSTETAHSLVTHWLTDRQTDRQTQEIPTGPAKASSKTARNGLLLYQHRSGDNTGYSDPSYSVAARSPTTNSSWLPDASKQMICAVNKRSKNKGPDWDPKGGHCNRGPTRVCKSRRIKISIEIRK